MPVQIVNSSTAQRLNDILHSLAEKPIITMKLFQFKHSTQHPLRITLSPAAEQLREEVRTFLADTQRSEDFTPQCDAWIAGYDPSFSKKLGERGWLGMTWPKKYGGRERPSLERFVLSEELLVVGAPVAAHWVADRQTGTLLLRYGTEAQKTTFSHPLAAANVTAALG